MKLITQAHQIDDPKYIKKPLSIKTRQRIARGLQHFGGPLAPLYIRLLDLEEPNPETASEIPGSGAPSWARSASRSWKPPLPRSA